jgi:tetratricopeptide (TPR) repeat protein
MMSIDSSFNNISNSNLTFGITTETLKDIIEPYKLSLELLKEKLSHALPLEEKIKLENQLIWAEKELEKKIEEVARLQKTIDDIKPNEKILSKAKEILTTNGVDEAIAYLQSSEARAKKSMVDELMIEQAKQFQFEAQLLIVQNRYYEAKVAYEQILRYDRSHDRLFEVALFLQEKNDFKDAKRYYTEALKIYRDLATKNPDVYNPFVATTLNNLAVLERDENHNDKAREYHTEALEIRRALANTNPDVYKPDVAMTLNNLAVLERDENHNDKAREYHTEALEIRRALATTNPYAFEIDYAQSLIMGVDLFEQDREDLTKAKEILSKERYQNIYRTKKLLDFANSL